MDSVDGESLSTQRVNELWTTLQTAANVVCTIRSTKYHFHEVKPLHKGGVLAISANNVNENTFRAFFLYLQIHVLSKIFFRLKAPQLIENQLMVFVLHNTLGVMCDCSIEPVYILLLVYWIGHWSEWLGAENMLYEHIIYRFAYYPDQK